ncbi:hypothetical protein FRB99_005141 [Tulasnella sp. 403]|nr:hypothetical protein FRB99_005141 [Tulasnella sp. 403]
MASPSAPSALPSCLLPPFPPPLQAPVALDGVDVSLATEILPPPPPLFTSNSKRPSEYLRKRVLPSYLPSMDPGSTYNAGTGVKVADYVVTDDEGSDRGSKRKRQRTEKAEYIRAKKPPATSTPPAVSAPPSGSLAPVMSNDPIHADATPLSPSLIPADANAETPPPPNSIPPHVSGVRSRRSSGLLAASRLSQLDWSLNLNGNGKRKDELNSAGDIDMRDASLDPSDDKFAKDSLKGKGKERGSPNDEHQTNSPECSTCRMSLLFSAGGAVYCDGCPRSFHLCCLEPPLDASEIGKGEWFCKKCVVDMRTSGSHVPKPALKSNNPLFGELIQKAETETPSIFLLPEDIRSYFRDVGTTTDGSYVDTGELRGLKSNRPGFIEERDPYRLKDRQGLPVLCYKCGTSATPSYLVPLAQSSFPTSNSHAVANRSSSLPIPDVDSYLKSPRSYMADYSDRGGPSTISVPTPEDFHASAQQSDQDTSSQASLPIPTESEIGSSSSNTITNPKPQRRSSRRPVPVQYDRPTPAKVSANHIEPRSQQEGNAKSVSEPGVGPGIRLNPGDTTSGWRSMLSCDYCLLSWHLDCLDPPLVCLPPPHKKWMCPNHAEHVLPKRRTPRQLRTVNLLGPSSAPPGRRRAHLNIEIIPDVKTVQPLNTGLSIADTVFTHDETPGSGRSRKRPRYTPEAGPPRFDDLVANGIKYRIPERSVRIDFWNFVNRSQGSSEPKSRPRAAAPDRAAITRERARRTLSSASSLSSLSSPPSDTEAESDSVGLGPRPSGSYDASIAVLAEALVSLKSSNTLPRVSTAVQTELHNAEKLSPQSLAQLVKTALKSKEKHNDSPTEPQSSTRDDKTTTITPSKPPTPSFKIRIPGLATRHAISNAAASAKQAGPRRSARQKEPQPSPSAGFPITIVKPKPSSSNPLVTTPTPSVHLSLNQASQGGSMSSDELDSLRAIRDILAMKGEKAVLDWLKS